MHSRSRPPDSGRGEAISLALLARASRRGARRNTEHERWAHAWCRWVYAATMTSAFRVRGTNSAAPFTLTVHRGEGMALLAMNWRRGRPPIDFVGFGIQYLPPGRTKPFNVTNRLSFRGVPSLRQRQPSMVAPIQKFRWVHFPFDADQSGLFEYIVTPVFMNPDDSLRYGDVQRAGIELHSETLPGVLNVGFTRGFVSSQAFVDRFERDGAISTLLPGAAQEGLRFIPTHPKAMQALEWMGFEARQIIFRVLDEAIADPTANVRVIGYELSSPEVVSRLEQLGPRLRIIIDDSADHDALDSAETQAAVRLSATAGAGNVIRQHMGNLQHNKTIVVTGPTLNRVVCGSTNFSWRGLFVQNNNAVVLSGAPAVAPFVAAFEQYWMGGTAAFRRSAAPAWADLGLKGVRAKVTFSPHSAANAVLGLVGDDIRTARSSLLYSLAFLYLTTGAVRDAVKAVTETPSVFVAGISDRAVGGIAVQTPSGNVAPVFPAALSANVPAPFSS